MMINVGMIDYTEPYAIRIRYSYDTHEECVVKSTLEGWGEPVEEVLTYAQAIRQLREHRLPTRELMKVLNLWDGD